MITRKGDFFNELLLIVSIHQQNLQIIEEKIFKQKNKL